MADQAYSTAASANGQQVFQKVKNKEVVGFSSRQDLENYVLGLLGMQEGLCALTDLRMQLDGEEDDR